MPFQGLNLFVKTLEESGELVRISEFINPEFEIAEITDRFCKLPDGGKAILFENTGTSFPVLSNAFGSERRLALAMGHSSFGESLDRFDSFFVRKDSSEKTFQTRLKDLFPLFDNAQWAPKALSGRGECQEVVHMDADLSILPSIRNWSFDCSPLITLPIINSVDPGKGGRFVSNDLIQVFSKNILGIHQNGYSCFSKLFKEYQKRGEHMPIAISLGGDPLYTLASMISAQTSFDMYLLAGFMRQERLKLVKGITVDIDVPYDADIVIEGYIDPFEELIWGGWYGSQTGFYAQANWLPKFYVTCITHRKDAIFPTAMVGIPPAESIWKAKSCERIILNSFKECNLPELIDINIPELGGGSSIAVVKISKTYIGQAYRVANFIWGTGQLMVNKIMILVSGDIDIRNYLDLGNAISKHFNPATDFFIGKGPLNISDHSTTVPGFGGKLLLDATEKNYEEHLTKQHPGQLFDSEEMAEILASIDTLIYHFNTSLISENIPILFLSVDKSFDREVKDVASQVIKNLEGICPKIMVFVDKEIPVLDLYFSVWYALSNTDPLSDCYLLSNTERIPCLVIDGTRKGVKNNTITREVPNITISSKEIISNVDAKWESLSIGSVIKSPSEKFGKIHFGRSAYIK
jgi:4-hydroxy-3-polyprenylbenzoate decarboxylase